MMRLEPSHENGLSNTSTAGAFQVRSVHELRFVSRLGGLRRRIWMSPATR